MPFALLMGSAGPPTDPFGVFLLGTFVVSFIVMTVLITTSEVFGVSFQKGVHFRSAERGCFSLIVLFILLPVALSALGTSLFDVFKEAGMGSFTLNIALSTLIPISLYSAVLYLGYQLKESEVFWTFAQRVYKVTFFVMLFSIFFLFLFGYFSLY